MKKSELIKAGLFGAAVFAFAATGAQAQEFVLKLHQFLPAQAPVPAGVLVPWMAKIEAESGGRIKFEHYPAMQLGGKPGEAQQRAVFQFHIPFFTFPPRLIRRLQENQCLPRCQRPRVFLR